MKIPRESPEHRSVEAGVERAADRRAELTPESIQSVRDFTARKTLERAHALVSGLAALAEQAPEDEAARAILDDLASVGVRPDDAARIANQALDLVDIMADRDRKADVFHAAVKEASQAERAMYERLAALARVLRERLGHSPAALARLGVPPDAADLHKARPRAGKAIYSALAVK